MRSIIKIIAFILALVGSYVLLSGFGAYGWDTRTPLGIRVKAPTKAIAQYEAHWSLSWDEINLEAIDDLFLALQGFHGTNYDPRKLKIMIRPFRSCGDDLGINGPCYEGWLAGSSITIHLGDDPGQGESAWCRTALSHEMNHWFLRGTPCFWGIDRGECHEQDPSGWDFGLCGKD